MKIIHPLLLNLLVIILFTFSCSQKSQERQKSNTDIETFNSNEYKKLNKLNTRLGKPNPGDWLYYKDESGQSFNEYTNSNPVVPTKKRNKIEIQEATRKRNIADLRRA